MVRAIGKWMVGGIYVFMLAMLGLHVYLLVSKRGCEAS